MNVFRPRRKPKESNVDGDGSTPTVRRSGRTFRRPKKSTEPAPEIDWANALPSKEELRTSLLLPNLTARFSMLRARDDPFAVFGRAGDDVLLGRPGQRASRHLDLAGIAQVDSIRPPFANRRAASTASADDYATDDDSLDRGSARGRARPGQTNTLFGGRQKVYKLPATGLGSTKDLNGAGTRFWYDHDLHRSAFRSHRDDDDDDDDDDRPPPEGSPSASPSAIVSRHDGEAVVMVVTTGHGGNDDDHHRGRRRRPSCVVDSPSLSRTRSVSSPPPPSGSTHDRKRETSSSTASAPSNNGRISTAATSIASQVGPPTAAVTSGKGPSPGLVGLDPTPSLKARRLYDAGLDQHLHDQQSSALGRLDRLARQRRPGGGATSPPPGPPSSVVGVGAPGARARARADSSPTGRDRHHDPRTDDVAGPSLRPSPRPAPVGGGWQTSTLDLDRPSSFPVRLVGHGDHDHDHDHDHDNDNDHDDSRMRPGALRPRGPTPGLVTVALARPIPPGYDERSAPRPVWNHRGRTAANPSSRTGSPSASRLSSVDGRLGDGPGRSGSDPSGRRPSVPTSLPSRPPHDAPSPSPSPPGVVAVSTPMSMRPGSVPGRDGPGRWDGESEAEGERLLGISEEGPTWASVDVVRSPEPGPLPSLPSFLPSTPAEDDEEEVGSLPPKSESPPSGGTANLSGLVQRHLRSDSHQSNESVPPVAVPAELPRRISAVIPDLDRPSRRPARPVGSPVMAPSSFDPSTLPTPTRPMASTGSPERPSLRHPTDESTRRHTRNVSAETRREREEFDHELAQRRRMVRENMKTVVGGERAATAPPPQDGSTLSKVQSKRISPLRTSSAMGMLRSTSVQSSVSGKTTSPRGIIASSDALRDSISESSGRRPTVGGDPRRRVLPDPPPTLPPLPPSASRNWGQIRRDARREMERRQREHKDIGRSPDDPMLTTTTTTPPTPSPSSSRSSTRARSSSGASTGRSRSNSRQLGPDVPLPALPSHRPVPAGLGGRPGSPRRGPPLPSPVSSHPPRESDRPMGPSSPVSAHHHHHHHHLGPDDPQRSRDPGHGHRRVPALVPIDVNVPSNLYGRPSPLPPRSAASTSYAGSERSSPWSATDSPSREQAFPPTGTLPAHRKRVVLKSTISEPTLVSCTSDITATVDVHQAAQAGLDRDDFTPPPVPPINPRRRTRFPGPAATTTTTTTTGSGSRPNEHTAGLSGLGISDDRPSAQDVNGVVQRSTMWIPSGPAGPTTTNFSHPQANSSIPSRSTVAWSNERRPPVPLVPPLDGSMF